MYDWTLVIFTIVEERCQLFGVKLAACFQR